MSDVETACCSAGINSYKCDLGGWCCGCGSCNIFCCNCEDGCNKEYYNFYWGQNLDTGYLDIETYIHNLYMLKTHNKCKHKKRQIINTSRID